MCGAQGAARGTRAGLPQLWRRAILILLVTFLWGVAPPAQAHNQSYAVIRAQFAEDGAFEISLSCHVAALLMGQAQGHLSDDLRERWGRLGDEEIRKLSERASVYLLGAVEVYADSRRFALERIAFPDVASLREDGLVPPEEARPSDPVMLYGRLPSGAREFALAAPIDFTETLMSLQTATGVTLAQVLREGQISHPFAIRDEGGVSVTIPPLIVTAYQYILLGFEHIIPKGWDHILFVLGLFLLAPQWRPLATQVTVFTIAHSVTLALAVFGLVFVPSLIVEPLIAATIIAVAADNLFSQKLRTWRTVTVFIFGLLHGLGFASVLRAVGLPAGEEAIALVSFNVGVEIGQLAVLAGAFLAVGWFRSRSWYHSRIAAPASLVIGVIGAVWLIERVVANL